MISALARAAGIACCLIASACAEQLDAHRAAIVGGADAERREVVPLGGGICGATVLAPNLLLTAKHCVAGVYPGPWGCTADGEVVRPDGNVEFPDAAKYGPVRAPEDIVLGRNQPDLVPRVSQVLVTPGETLCEDDGALLVLDGEMDDPSHAALDLVAPPAPGAPLVAVGYGATLESESSTLLQAREVAVEAIGPAEAVPEVSDPVPPGFFTVGEALCRGDSGSPGLTDTGGVAGVASSVGRVDLDEPTGTSSDCVSPLARGRYQSLAAMADLVLEGFAAAGAEPWIAGQPDPRAELAGFGEACTADGDCRSNACVDQVCTHGCLDVACPPGYDCARVEDRQRCVPAAAAPDAGAAQGADGGGCGCGAASGSSSPWALLLLALLALLLAVARSSRSDLRSSSRSS